jgi:hypothetical protein
MKEEFSNYLIIQIMKLGLFIVSVLGVGGAAYFLVTTLLDYAGVNQTILIALLVILLLNSVIGILITYSAVIPKPRLKMYSSKNRLFRRINNKHSLT